LSPFAVLDGPISLRQVCTLFHDLRLDPAGEIQPNPAGRLGRWSILALTSVIAMIAGGRAMADDTPVDLELVLAVDVSGSVDDMEAQLQRDGYIAAMDNPQVLDAIRSGPLGAIAVTYVEWGTADFQHTAIRWRQIASVEDAKRFADELSEVPLTTSRYTSISGVIDYAVDLFENNGFEGLRRVIDISGDGTNNSGPPVELARDEAVARGIVINGLPILNDRPNPFGGVPPVDLDRYYERHVIGGAGAFQIPARDFQAFGAAILAKLVREIADAPPGERRSLAETALRPDP
jgi:hypothetical protein